MQLRPRQREFVDACKAALLKHKNTLGVAPTGAGKTIMLSATTGELIGAHKKALILQHRDELVSQNQRKYMRVNPTHRTGCVDAKEKNWSGNATFAMVQTLSRPKRLENMPPQDLIVVDETHRVAADSYLRIIERAREMNQDCMVFGVTATPQRSDSKGLREVFDNIGDQITIGELIAGGYLVRPRTYVIDLGVQDDLKAVRRSATDFDMTEVSRIMDHTVHNDRIVAEWKERAGDRRTVVFCADRKHAQHVTEAFIEAGVKAAMVHGDLGKAERREILAAIDQGELQVVVNVAVLTEGWDCPPVSCVVLLRPSSHQTTMIQMIGRGLRTVDPEEYPGVQKSDCIVMDFGISVLTHGSLEQKARLGGPPRKPGEAPKKKCPKCKAELPIQTRECTFCGFEFSVPAEEETTEKSALEDFALTEIDLFNASSYRWEAMWDGTGLVASAFDAWAVCLNYQGQWYAVGGSKETGMRLLSVGERLVALAQADDYLRDYGDKKGAGKAKRWLNSPATPKQLEMLGLNPMTEGHQYNRYQASCLLTWKFNHKGIRAKVMQHAKS